VAFIANSFIFLLIGAQEAQQHFRGLWSPVAVAIALVMLGGAVAIYPLCALLPSGQRRRARSIERENYSVMATPLKLATPVGLDVAAGARSP
jgi:NhaP-type Na+/H+ or K+/H+ antiporter